MTRSTNLPIFQLLSLHLLVLVIFKWSPGFTLSSILFTPHPLPLSKCLSSFVALAPQDQQNSYLQNPQVMWLQPRFFSILVRHMGQKDTLSLFSSAQPASYLFIASSHVTSSPCHSSRQLKQIQVEHLGHCSFWAPSSPRICYPQSGLGQNLTRGS